MTRPSRRSHTLALTTCTCLCLGWAFACGETTENDAPARTTGGITTGGPTTGGPTTGGPTTGGGGTTGSDCPSLEPAEGSGCSVNRVCAYANCAAPDYRDYHELNCINGAWVLALTEACQVGPCPAYPPEIGSYCDGSVTPGPCATVDACGEQREVVCTNYGWQPAANEAPDLPASTGGGGTGNEPPLCPAVPPYAGERCCPTAVPERCDYTDSGSAGAAGASFIIIPGTSTGGDGDAPYPLQCAVCTDQMYWSRCIE